MKKRVNYHKVRFSGGLEMNFLLSMLLPLTEVLNHHENQNQFELKSMVNHKKIYQFKFCTYDKHCFYKKNIQKSKAFVI